MEKNIFSQIRLERNDFMYQFIQVVQGYPFNQYLNIKRTHLYLNSKYEDASKYHNRDKLFFNITTYPCEVATKNLNVDTKHIRLQPLNEKSKFGTFLLEKELVQWLKKNKFGNILNQIADELPKFGSVVVEKTPDGANLVDIRRLIIDQTVESIKKSRFIDTIHYMTPTELRETGWNNVERAIGLFSQTEAPDTYEDKRGSLNLIRSTPYVKVYKRYGEVPEWWIDEKSKSDKLVKALFICAGVDYNRKSDDGTVVLEEQGVVLFKSRWYKDWPFQDFHYNKIRGRWQGLGIVEILYDIQERINELKNQKRIAMELSSLHLFQTQDKLIMKNALTDLVSGDIITTRSDLKPVQNEERNLPAFDDEEKSYIAQAERLSFAYEAVRGEALPATTPATNALLANQQATSVYAFKRENFTNSLRDFFNDFVASNLLKDLSQEHIMRFTGTVEDLAKLDEAAADIYANDVILNNALKNKKVTTLEEQEKAKQEAIKHFKTYGQNRFVKIKQNYYNNLEFEYDFNIANEQIDPATVAQNVQVVMTPLIQRYGLEDPRVMVLFNKYCEALGVNTAELDLADNNAKQRSNLLANQLPQNGQNKGQQFPAIQNAGQIQANAVSA